MKILILFVLLFSNVCFAGPFVDIGYDGRPKGAAVDAGYMLGNIGGEIGYLNEGKQPNGIPNLNEVVHIGMVGRLPVTDRLAVFGRLGVATMRQRTDLPWSGFNGTTAGVGLRFKLTPTVGVYCQALEIHTKQAIGEYENFTALTAGLAVGF